MSDPIVDTEVLLSDPPAEVVPQTGTPASVTPTVTADIKADSEGKPRSREETPPPPGTDREPYLKSAGFKAAVIATVLAVETIWIVPVTTAAFGSDGSLLVRIAMWLWLASVGIKNPDTLRWK